MAKFINQPKQIIKIKNLLLALGLSQTELAIKLNISRQRMNNIATGNGNFTDKQRIMLYNLFNINLNWLIVGEGEIFITPKEEKPVLSKLKEEGVESDSDGVLRKKS
jgi:transcriptional regulator with XRE-family HTH domain